MFFHPKNLKSENNNPWFKPWFNILLHTQSIVCATVDSQCLEDLGYITLPSIWIRSPDQINQFFCPWLATIFTTTTYIVLNNWYLALFLENHSVPTPFFNLIDCWLCCCMGWKKCSPFNNVHVIQLISIVLSKLFNMLWQSRGVRVSKEQYFQFIGIGICCWRRSRCSCA